MTEMLDDKTAIAAQFRGDGFTRIPHLADPVTLQQLRETYDGMLDGSIPCPGTDRQLGGLTRQIMYPHEHHPIFASNAVLERARDLSKELMQVDDPQFLFSMLIYKPPGHPHETPWHQDVAYAAKPVTPAGTSLDNDAIVQFWLALDDVDETMGCMEFIQETPRHTVMPHIVASGSPDDDGRLLAIDGPEELLDLAQARSIPLEAGSATVHGYTTPHFTGPNNSNRARRAYIFSFANQAKLDKAMAELGASR